MLVTDSTTGVSEARQRDRDEGLITSLNEAFRDDFTAGLDPSNWRVVIQGPNQTLDNSVPSEFRINAGTGANQETIIRSRRGFKMPFRVWFTGRLSQRIANQEFCLELVNEVGDMAARWHFDGITATNAKIRTVNGGVSGTESTLTIATTASNTIFEIDMGVDEVNFAQLAVDSTANRTVTACRTVRTPDPNDTYYVQIRAKNLGSAPASNTALFMEAVSVMDITEVCAEVNGRGDSAGNRAAVVVVANAPNRPAYGWNNDTTTALAANATFTGTSRDHNTSNAALNFVATFSTDQPGTARIEMSNDATTWRRATPDTAVAANSPVTLSVPILTRYYRVIYVNGGTAQGFLMINSRSVQ